MFWMIALGCASAPPTKPQKAPTKVTVGANMSPARSQSTDFGADPSRRPASP